MGLGASRQREGLSWLAMVATWLCHGEAGFSGKTELGALSRMVDMFWALLEGREYEQGDGVRDAG